MSEIKSGLSATALKYIAIAAMTVDHIGWAFVKTPTLLGQSMHILGRMTIVIMSFFIAEGYIHTKNYNRYLGRIIVFAILSQPFYIFFQYPTGFENLSVKSILEFNVLFSLAFALISLKIYDSKQSAVLKAIEIIAVCAASYMCDWCFFPTLFTLGFYITRGDSRKTVKVFSALAISAFMFYVIRFILDYDVSLRLALRYDGMMLGLFFGIVPICLYNGQLGSKGKFSKWIFYVYYPLHLLVLGLIVRLK